MIRPPPTPLISVSPTLVLALLSEPTGHLGCSMSTQLFPVHGDAPLLWKSAFLQIPGGLQILLIFAQITASYWGLL